MKAHLKSKTSWAGLMILIGAAAAYFTGQADMKAAIGLAITGVLGLLTSDMKK